MKKWNLIVCGIAMATLLCSGCTARRIEHMEQREELFVEDKAEELHEVENTIDHILALDKEMLEFEGDMPREASSGTTFSIYADEQKNQYYYDVEGNLIGFLLNEPIALAAEMESLGNDHDEMNEIASGIGGLVDLREYTLEEDEYNESVRERYLVFYKYIDGYKTTDYVSLMLDEKGALFSYIAPNIGKFDALELPLIDEVAIERELAAQLAVQYENRSYEYEITDRMIDKTEEQWQCIMSVEVTDDAGYVTGNQYYVKIAGE